MAKTKPRSRSRRSEAPEATASEWSALAEMGRRLLKAHAVAILLQTNGDLPVSTVASAPSSSGDGALDLAREHLRRAQASNHKAFPAPNGKTLLVGIEQDGRPIGVLTAVRGSGDVFSPEDWELAGAVAWQAAAAVHRVGEGETLLRLMRALAEVEAGSGTGSAERWRTEEDVVHEARTVLGFAGGALYLASAPDDPARLVLTEGAVPVGLPEALPSGVAPSEATLIPLVWGEGLRGALALFRETSDGRTCVMSPVSLDLIASRIATSLGTVRLVHSEREQRRMAEALQEASLAIDRALDLNEVLDRILEQVTRAFPCDAANFMSYEGDVSRILRWRGYERFGLSDDDMAGVSLNAQAFHNLKRLATGEAVTVPDTATDPTWVFNTRFEWLRSWAGVPVRYGDTILGFVMLDSASPGTFSDESADRLLAFAAHAGAAMHNARLYNRLAREHTRLRQVHSIGRRFSGSLSREEILDKLGIATLEALGGDSWSVFLPNRHRTGSYEPFGGGGANQANQADEVWVSRVAEAFAPDVRALETPGGPWTQLAFPLTSGDRTHAVAVVGVRGVLPEPESWLDVLRPVGQQAGLALASAEEHAIVQRRLAELTALQSIVRHIAGRLEVDSVLREVTHELNVNLGFPVVQVYMRRESDLDLRQHSGPSPILTRITIDQGIVGRAARLEEPQLVPDVRKDPDYIAGLVGTRAEAAVPILAQERVIGILNVETSDPDQLDREALELLELLADQLSIALQNASLFEAAQTNVEALEGRVRERTAQLEQVLEQAVAAERVKAQFVADVSHELRTPLTNIGLYLDLLELSDDDRRNEYMSTLRRETERLARLIDQLLAMSHLDTGQAELRRTEIDLNALMKVLLGDRARMIARRGLKLEMKPDPDLPPVQGDPQYLMQVMTNLLSNAVNYTPEGGRITLETGLGNWQNTIYATLTVRDTGPGIPEEEQTHIFERFYRGLYARASGVSGTGLGLAISQEIMTRHGGRLTLFSRAGAGAAFTMWLPLVPPARV
jgi:signal transduction histidine kinase